MLACTNAIVVINHMLYRAMITSKMHFNSRIGRLDQYQDENYLYPGERDVPAELLLFCVAFRFLKKNYVLFDYFVCLI